MMYIYVCMIGIKLSNDVTINSNKRNYNLLLSIQACIRILEMRSFRYTSMISIATCINGYIYLIIHNYWPTHAKRNIINY